MKCCRFLPALVLLSPCLSRAIDSVVIFNEVQYHPAEGQAEWIELHNVMSVNVDLSDWQITGGADYTFPAATVIPAGGYLVVKGVSGTAPAGATGPFTGSLDNKGETIRLRNVAGRLMDELTWAPDGRWPAGADGSGATLSRRSPVSPGGVAESWRASMRSGGSPGAENFPAGPPLGPPVTLAGLADPWTYNQSGADPGVAWLTMPQTAGTGGWQSGPGIFAFENATLPAPVGTALTNPATSGAAIHYFQKTFMFAGDPAGYLVQASLLVDDGAVVYLNGHEVLRRNLPEGPLTGATRAEQKVGTAAFSGAITLPPEHLVNGMNVLSVAVYQPASPQPYVILTGGGLALAEELGTMDEAANLALASKGAVPFAKDLLPGYPDTHNIPFLNNGTYGNPSSWIGNSTNSFCGINLGATSKTVRSIAFGRDNTGGFADRSLGIYTLQYTTTPGPNAQTPAAAWTTIGTLNYQSAGGGSNFAAPSRRHRFNFTAVEATGIRLICPGSGIGTGACVDEIELYEQPGDVVVPQPVKVTPAAGYGLTWDGNDGVNSGGVVPSNLARAADGGTAFASGELGPSLGLSYHLIRNINDGQYTNPFSWIGANSPNQYAAVKFGGLVEVSKVAWGRDNSNLTTDRSLGTYTIQITRVAEPGTTTAETGNADTGWESVGTAAYLFTDPAFTQNLRHEFTISKDGKSIPATALRLKVSDPGIAIDELEVYGLEQPDVVFGMTLTAAELLPSPDTIPVVLSEVGGTSDAVWKVELYNRGSETVNLVTLTLNGRSLPPEALPAGTLAPGARLVLEETKLGFRPAAGEALTLMSGTTFLDAVALKSTVRAYSGDRWLTPAAATFGGPNVFTLRDEVVINEIHYHAAPFPSTAETPVTDNPVEWIELLNRSGNAVDLSGWRLDGEASYAFPAGTTLPAGGYLVVAGQDGTPPAGAIGPFSGSLSNRLGRIELEDAAGNPADEVHYYGAGWSDGGGSTLELTDARAENGNSLSGAWRDSDESGKSQWQTFTYRMNSLQRFGPATWNELRIGMLDTGECLIDDIRVVRDPDGAAVQVVQNGDFTAGSTKWRFLGNHRHSTVIPEPGNAGNNVLRVQAGGPAETNHNHIESTFLNNTALVNNAVYEISFRARWLRGTNQLNVKAYYAKLAKTVELAIPANAGSPGAANSGAVPNAGPILTGLRHEPVLPEPGQNAVVSLVAADPDGVAAGTLHYRVNGQDAFTPVPMALTAGRWTAAIPGQTAGTIVQFYAELKDSQNAVRTAPAGGAASRALIQWTAPSVSTLPAQELRLLMLDSDRDFLLALLNRVSSERQPGTLVYRGGEVFYDVGIRLQGTPAGRVRDGEAYPGYDIGFPPDHLFRGVHDGIGIDRSGRAPVVRGQDEIYVKHTFHRAGIVCTIDDLCTVVAPAAVHSGTAILQMANYNGTFVSSQFDEEGTVFNLDVTYDPNSTTDGQPESVKQPVPFGHVSTDFTNLGPDKEQYRGPFDIRSGRRRDNYTQLMAFSQAMASNKPLAASLLDLDASLRCTALVNLWSIADTYYTGGLPHNIRLFVPDSGRGITLLPWDNDFVATNGPTAPLYSTANNLGALIGSSPAIRRRYFGHLHHLCHTVFKTGADGLDPWFTHYGSVVGQTMTGMASFVTARRNHVLGQMPATIPFAVTTNSGADLTVDTNSTVLDGTAWVDVSEIRIGGTDLKPVLTWTGDRSWRFTLPLLPGANAITLEAVGYGGTVIATDTITITSTQTAPDVRDHLRITELHYHPANPSTPAELAVSPDDAEFEFIELQNTSNAPLDVGGVHFTAGVDFAFPAGSTLAAGQYAVLVRNAAAFAARYGEIPVTGSYAPDSLNNTGETLTLADAAGRPVFSFAWTDDWFPRSDGPGWTMVPRTPADTASLNGAGGWGLSAQIHGNPGAANPGQPGAEFAGWRHHHFTPAEIDDSSVSGMEADPQHAGVTNLLRYAFGLTPQDAAQSALPGAATVNGNLRITFRRLKNAADLTYHVETSADAGPGAWGPVAEAPVIVQDNGDGTETVRVDTPATGGRKFVRVRVQKET